MNDETLAAIGPYLRKTPKQYRSRARLESLLDATLELLGEHGTDQITVTSLATHLGIASSSIYEYVDGIDQLLGAVAVRGMYSTHQRLLCLELGGESVDDLRVLLQGAVDAYIDQYRQEPGLRVALATLDADPAFAAVRIADSRRTSTLFIDLLRPFLPQMSEQELSDMCFLLVHLAGDVARLVDSLPREEGRRMIATYISLALSRIPTA